MFSRAFTALVSTSSMASVRVSFASRSSPERTSSLNRRMDRVGSVYGQGWDDGVDPGVVWQSSIYHGRGIVDPTPHRRDDAVDDLEKMTVVLESDVGLEKLPLPLHPYVIEGVDQDIGHLGILHERFDGAQSEDLVQDLLGKSLPLPQVQGDGNPFLVKEILDHLPDRLLGLLPSHGVQVGQIQTLEKLPVNARLELGEVSGFRKTMLLG